MYINKSFTFERRYFFTITSKIGYYMNKVITKKNKPSYKVILFWSIISLLTLIFIAFVVVKFIDNQREVNKLDELNNLTGQQIFDKEGTYYVFVYSKVGVTESKLELDKLEDLEEAILNYLTYVKRNSDKNKMYGMIVDGYENYSCLVEGSSLDTSVVGKTNFADLRIHKADLPILLKIQNGKVISAFLTESDIRKEIQNAILS